MGLWLLQSSLPPFLWMGIAFAILSRFGNMPWLKDRFIIDRPVAFVQNDKIL